MSGETDLDLLLATMRPTLDPVEYGYGQVRAFSDLPPGLTHFALIAEDEGVTVVAPVGALTRAGISHEPGWARISLSVHSSLSAVGLTARIAATLAIDGISANVIAGLMHDHFFVQWDRRDDAMAALVALAGTA